MHSKGNLVSIRVFGVCRAMFPMTAFEGRAALVACIVQHLHRSRSPLAEPVTALIARRRNGARPAASATAPVCAHLPAALSLCPEEGLGGAMADALKQILDGLHWVADYPEQSVLKDTFGHAVIAATANVVIGCNLLAARTDYPAHAHPAGEIYLPLSCSGALYWQESTGRYRPGSPGDTIVHGAHEPHAMTTLDHPVLNLWVQFGSDPGGPARFVQRS